MARALRQQATGLLGAMAGGHQLLQLSPQQGPIPRLWTRQRRRAAQHQGAFAQGWGGQEMGQGRRHRGPHLLLVAFGQLPGHHQGPVAQHRQQILQQSHQPVGGLVQHHGALLSGEGLQPLAAGGAAGR